ncbi:MAG: trimethylamine methyltransferase family protein, partial [Thermoleophilia bacterium]|nr:trimethylamine methyltransferase family protein [Thermoleophilia bacterium]
MTDDRRHGRRAKSSRGSGGISQLPWMRVRNMIRPIEIASADEIEKIHRTALRILEDLGIRVIGDRVLDLFETAGARV